MLVDSVFGPWTPDLPDLNNPGVTVAHNVTPGVGSIPGSVTYGPMKRASVYSATSMASRPLGTAVGQDSLGTAKVYGGCATKLYKVNPANRQWLDVSRAAGYATADTEQWRSAQYGSAVIMSNYTDAPQFIDMNVDTQFADLTSLVQGRYVSVFKNFAILANTYDPFDGAKTNRIRWSADGNPFDFNFSVATQSDFQDINDFGSITGVVTDDYVWVLMQRGIVQGTYRGDEYVFQFDTAWNGKGCSVPQSVVTVAGKTFFLSDDGFYQMEKGNFSNIGIGKVNKTFLADADLSKTHRMSVAADPDTSLVYWQYCSKAATDGSPDRIIIYNYNTGCWSDADATSEIIFNAMSLPWTIDQLDVYGTIDDIPVSLDSAVWAGGKPMLWGASLTGDILVLGGATLQATIETQEQHLINTLRMINPQTQGDRTTVIGVRPFYEGNGATASLSVGTRALTNDTVEWTPIKTAGGRKGFAYFRKQSRFHRFRLLLNGEWTQASLLQIEANPAGYR
ncbi:hypothetical protein [Neorhizobium sp. T7_12]|uniref:hypothetical protein n=1 Tax=Neorhizobium sp. T7_12 TaxID=2093832 RepID=UPI000CF8B7B1|nr:hypothetical protein [Neorhizobium sp. T7_12]